MSLVKLAYYYKKMPLQPNNIQAATDVVDATGRYAIQRCRYYQSILHLGNGVSDAEKDIGKVMTVRAHHITAACLTIALAFAEYEQDIDNTRAMQPYWWRGPHW
jgi:hypothetical protein